MAEEKNHYDKFIENIYTKVQLSRLLNEIEVAKSYAYKKAQNMSLSNKIEKKVSEDFFKVVAEMESAGSLPTASKPQADFFNRLKEYVLSMPVCRITVSFNPSLGFLKKVSGWFTEKVGKRVISDIKVREEVVAGAQIEFEGEYRDFSISEVIDGLIDDSNLGGVKK